MSNYRIARVANLVHLPLRQRIDAEPAFQKLNYSQLQQAIFDLHYTYSDSFGQEMRRQDNECIEILYDVQSLQKKWVEERGLDIDFSEHWQLKVLLAQLKEFNPDFIYFQGFSRFKPRQLDEFRSYFPNLKRFVVHSGFFSGFEDATKDTVIFGGISAISNKFASLGLDSYLLYHSFDQRILSVLDKNQEKIPVSFVGSSGYGQGNEQKVRYWELLKLAHSLPMQFWLDELRPESALAINPFVEQPLQARFYQLEDDDWGTYPDPFIPLSHLVSTGQLNPPVYGVPYYQTLANSNITIHRHTGASQGQVGAMRMFQATGVGCCLFTDSGSNMAELFEPDSEVVTYSSAAECTEKVKYLLENPTVADDIARKGQQKTLRQHSSRVRYEYVHEVLQQYL